MESIMSNANPVGGLYLISQTPQANGAESSDGPLEVVVVYTNKRRTLKALKTASAFAGDLDARVRLLVPQVVSYALPLNAPPVSREFKERQFYNLMADPSVDTQVDICLCRDKEEGVSHALKPHSLVIIGGHRRWWPDSEKKLAKRLRRDGHAVFLTKTE